MENKYHFSEENHLHFLGDKALTGCTTVLEVLGKTLTWWASSLALLPFGWTKAKDEDGNWVPRELRLAVSEGRRQQIVKLTDKEYLALLDSSYKAHATSRDKAASKGTDLHSLIEMWIKKQINKEDVEVPEEIKPFTDWAELNVKRFIASEVHVYSETLWTGGIMDGLLELKDGKLAILDIKSSKQAYFNHFVQTGGYSKMLKENGWFTDEGEKMGELKKPVEALIVFPFGAVVPQGYFRYDVENHEKAFEACVNLYRLKQSHEEAK